MTSSEKTTLVVACSFTVSTVALSISFLFSYSCNSDYCLRKFDALTLFRSCDPEHQPSTLFARCITRNYKETENNQAFYGVT